MNSSLRSFGLLFLAMVSISQAELVLVPDPVSSSASTSFAGDIANWGPQRLYDATPTTADLDTNFDAGNAQQYAGQGLGPHVLVFDYGSPVTFSGIAYSQRLGADPIADKVQNIDVWVSDTDPGAASVDLPGTLGASEANTGQLNTDAGLSTFANYNLGLDLTGRYVIFQLNDAGPGSFNPGGSELQLTFDTDPADPDLTAPATYDFGRFPAGSDAVTEQLEINNIGATQTLLISGITLEGPDAASFNIISNPTSLDPGASGTVVVSFTPGATPGPVEATAIIASDDALTADTRIFLTATLTTPIPDDLILLPDPTAITASTFFDASFGPEFLFDADPTLDDFENTDFDPIGQYAGVGEGPHVLVLDYGEPVDFNGIAYSQRLGGIIEADKVPAIEFWASNTDPGTAAIDLPILSDPAQSMTDLVITDTTPLLRYYPLNSILSGRYVIMRLAAGTFNPGGSELQLTLVGTPEPLVISSIVYPGGTSATVTWNSRNLKTYRVERSISMQGEWDELDDSVPTGGETTTFTDSTVPLDTPRMFYRVIEN